MKFLFIAMLFSSFGFSQTNGGYVEKMLEERKRFEEYAEKSHERIDKQQKHLENLQLELKEANDKVQEAKASREGKDEKIFVLGEKIAQARRSLPWLKRNASSEGKQLKCLEEAISSGAKIGSDCLKGYQKNLPKLKEDIEFYTQILSVSDSEFQSHIEGLEGEVLRKEEYLVGKQKQLKKEQENLSYYQERIEEKNANIRSFEEFRDRDQSRYSCGPKTKTIDLEADAKESGLGRAGVFNDLGRDHQNGVGSCFANTAKNLLYAATDGEDNASFLDIALHYQGDDLVEVDGGSSCPALDQIKKKGFCPKSNSPLETGEAMAAGLISSNATNVAVQAYFLEIIEDYLRGKNELDKMGLMEKLHPKAGKIIQALKENADIELPLPKVDVEIFKKYKVNEFYYWGYPKDKREIGYEAFKKEWDGVVDEFEVALSREIKKNPAFSVDKIKKQILLPFLKKHHVDDDWMSKILVDDVDKSLVNFDRNDYLKKLAATEEFYRVLSGEGDDFNIDEFLSQSCRPKAAKVMAFGGAIDKLVSYIDQLQLDPQTIANEKGFLSNKDLLQLAVAPNCLNPKNRKAVSAKFTCQANVVDIMGNNFGTDKKQMLRFVALKALENGLPIGNSFQTETGGWHINTVVGFRYNSDKKECEYKIRESQTARAYWASEEKISSKIYRVTVVEKE